MDILQRVHLVHTVLVFASLDINKDGESLLSLLYQWNSTTHTFFTGCQEVSPSLEDVHKILRLPMFGDGEVANISLSPDKAKAVKFLEDVVKKSLKKPILKATSVDTAFCTPYNLGPYTPMMLNSKTQGWFRVQSDAKLT